MDLSALKETAEKLAGQLEALAGLEEEVVGREAAALQSVLDVLKPLLPHLARELECGVKGIALVDRTEKVATGPHPYEDSKGEFRGQMLVLDAEGRFLEFEVSGEWSAPPLEPQEARTLTLISELGVAEVVRRYGLREVLEALGRAVAEMGREVAAKEKALRERAGVMGVERDLTQ